MRAFEKDAELHIAAGCICAIMRGGPQIPGKVPENYRKPRKTTRKSDFEPAGTASADREFVYPSETI